MNSALAIFICAVFVVLAGWHFHMAFSNFQGESIAVPSENGKPLLVPTAAITFAVGLVLLLLGVLVASTAGLVSFGLPVWLLTSLSSMLALGLLARAIGEFRYVGFFKKVRGSRFAKMDSLIYSPLCLLLSLGIAVVAYQNAV